MDSLATLVHTCVCVCSHPGAPGAHGYLQVHVLMWSHPGDLGTHACLYVRVLVVTSGRPWCTCMFVCAHMVISGRLCCTHVSVCVLTWSYLRDRGAPTCLCVFTLMWSHPGDLGAHVCLCVCMLVYSHRGQTCLQLRWVCLSLIPKANVSSCHAPPPCSPTRPRGEGATGKGQHRPQRLFRSLACPQQALEQRLGRTGSTRTLT